MSRVPTKIWIVHVAYFFVSSQWWRVLHLVTWIGDLPFCEHLLCIDFGLFGSHDSAGTLEMCGVCNFIVIVPWLEMNARIFKETVQEGFWEKIF